MVRDDAAWTLRCPRCDRVGAGAAGCAHCRTEGVAVNLEPPLADLDGLDLAAHGGGPWAWLRSMPVAAGTEPVTMGEGQTPIIRMRPRGGRVFWLKNEACNPTGSHKDRYMSAAVTKAVELGADTVIAASSGNAGASAAAYAARAGLRCVIVTKATLPMALYAQIRTAGAVIAAYADSVTRNRAMQAAVEALGWFPLTNYVEPGAGGHPYAIEGFKSIAYELSRDLGDDLAAVVVPTSRADLIAGMHRGFCELVAAGAIAATPRLVAAEPDVSAAFVTALGRSDPSERERTQIPYTSSPAFSIGSDVANYQGLKAIGDSGGTAIAVREEDYLAAYRACAAEEGIFLEASAAVAVTAARDLASQVAGEVVAIGTATGLKDPELALRDAEPLRVLDGGLEPLRGLVEGIDALP